MRPGYDGGEIMQEAPRHSVSVSAAVVREDGKVLAIRRADNAHWEPPGGVLELGETIEDGLRREVEDETGLLVEPDSLSGVYKNMNRGIVALVFRCHVVSGHQRRSSETDRVDWLAPAEIRDLMSEAYAVRVIDALNLDATSGPAIRSHDGRALLR